MGGNGWALNPKERREGGTQEGETDATYVPGCIQSHGPFPQSPIMPEEGGGSLRSINYFYKLQKQHTCFIIYVAQRDHPWLAPMTAEPQSLFITVTNRPLPASSKRTCRLWPQGEYYAAMKKTG